MGFRKMPGLVIALLGGLVAGSSVAYADDPDKPKTKEEEALVKNGEAFVAAFDKGDAKALAAFWTEDGDYVDQAGHHHKGRKAIQELYEKLFKEHKGLKLGITVTSLRVVKPDLAIEDGVTEVIPPGGGLPSGARYTVVHVKHDGKWLIESVREGESVAPSNYVHLQTLEWLIGEWVDEVEKGELARATYTWAENQNFIVSSFATTLKEVPIGGGTQWIAWDAAEKHIRSFSFDSSGGISEGTWHRDGNKYTIKTTTTTRTGKKVSATNIVTKVDNDHLTWQSTKRSVDGKDIPDTEVVKMKRVIQK
jgi:uncharacterized protein (TIGR02246 family)